MAAGRFSVCSPAAMRLIYAEGKYLGNFDNAVERGLPLWRSEQIEDTTALNFLGGMSFRMIPTATESGMRCLRRLDSCRMK